MKKSINKKSLKGVKWTSINTGFNVIITPIFYAVLAILLSPEEFAYIAVITLVFRLAPIIAKFGLVEAYIQNVETTKKQDSSLFFLTVILSVIVSIIIFLLSPYIEIYYGLENLELYIKLLLFAVLSEGILSIFEASIKKQFLFKESALILITTMFLRVVITIILIGFGLGVLSLVIGIIISTLFSLISYILVSYKKTATKISIYLNFKEILNFIQFGYPVTGKKFLEVLSQRADEIIIGAFLSAEVFGIYFFGKNMIMQIRAAIVKSFSVVLLPLYTQIKGSIKELKSTYFIITKYTAMIGFPALIGVSLTADIFVPFIFGDKWNDSIIVIQTLSIAIMLPIITGENATSILYSLGKPLLVFAVEIVSTFTYLIVLWTFIALGGEINTVLLLYSLFLGVNAIVLQYFVNKEIGSNLYEFIVNFKNIIVSLFIMVLGIIIFKIYLISSWTDLLQLIFIVFIGMILYVISELVFDDYHIKKLIKNMLK